MSIEIDLHIWDPGKADDRWVEFLEMPPEDRKDVEPKERVEAVLEVMHQLNAPAEWRLEHLAVLDLAFGQSGEPFHVEDTIIFEPLMRLLLVIFVDLGPQNSEAPSHQLLFENFGGMLHMDEATMRHMIFDAFDPHPTKRMQDALYPLEMPKDYVAQKKLTDAVIDFWQNLSPFLRKAQEAGSWKDEAFIIETVNGEVDDPQLLKRAVRHEKWLRKTNN